MAKKKEYYNNKNVNDDSVLEQFKKFIIILFVITLVILLLWFFIELKNGKFNRLDDESTTNEEVTIQHEEIMAGQTFNRKESEYYVIFADSNEEFYSIYKTYAQSSSDKIYLVDIANSINNKYISNDTNTNAQSSNELKVKDNTLIKISEGKNILYLEGYSQVLQEIKN